MSVTISGETILKQVLRKGGLGTVLNNADIGSLAAGSVTSVLNFRSGHHDTNTFRNLKGYWYRPSNATGVADYMRSTGDLTASTGALANDASWADTTIGSEDVYILYGIMPTWFVEDLNIAMRQVYFENMEPMSLAADAGFQSSATSSYTESDADGGAATTLTKVTTADSDNVFTGIASGRVLNAATDGYIRQRFNVHPGEQVYVGVLARADVGTASLVLYDVTNSAEINASGVVLHTGEQWAYMWRTESVPSTCEVLEVRLQGEGATDDIYYSGLWVQRVNDRRVRLSTTWDTAFKVPALTVASFFSNVGSGVESAFSMDLQEIPRSDYDFLFERPGANPYAVQWHRTPPTGPVYIQGRRAYSDLTTFTLALSETTACDLDLITAATLKALYEDERVVDAVPNVAAKLQKAYRELSGQAAIHQTTGPAQRRANLVVPRLGN